MVFIHDICCRNIQGDELKAETTRLNLPIPDPYVAEAPRQITDEEREFQAYRTLRNERAIARHEGARKVREAKVRTMKTYFGCSTEFLCLELNRRLRRRLARRSKRGLITLFLPSASTYYTPCLLSSIMYSKYRATLGFCMPCHI